MKTKIKTEKWKANKFEILETIIVNRVEGFWQCQHCQKTFPKPKNDGIMKCPYCNAWTIKFNPGFQILENKIEKQYLLAL